MHHMDIEDIASNITEVPFDAISPDDIGRNKLKTLHQKYIRNIMRVVP